jgi:RNA polymerase sigma factor (sigma-70 family)
MHNDTSQPIPELLQQWKQLFGLRDMLHEPDSLLIRRFREENSEAAFAALMSRHGPMVKSVCRRVLRNSHDIEDVVQATFLALARHARSTRDEYGAVAAWLHRTARNLALAQLRQLRRRESIGEFEPMTPDSTEEITLRETLQVLDEELQRLPTKYLSAVVLCFLEGLTQEEAARHLGCSRRTVSFRVDRARAMLARRLSRRGIVVGEVLLIASLRTTAEAASFAPRTGCFKATVDAAVQLAHGQPIVGVTEQVLALSQRAGSGLIHMNRLRVGVMLAVLLTTAVGLAATALLQVARAPGPERATPNVRVEEAKQTVSGCILDDGGQPAPNAAVAVLSTIPGTRGDVPVLGVLVQGQANETGQFRFEIPTTAQLERLGCGRLIVVARAEKQGVNWRAFPLDGSLADCSLKLTREKVIRCQVVLQDRPVVGAEVRVVGIGESLSLPTDSTLWYSNSSLEASTRVNLWPRSTTSDAEGYITLTGLDTDHDMVLGVRHAGQAEQMVGLLSHIQTGKGPMKLELPPARRIAGHILREDTGKPMRARVMLLNQFTGAYPFRPIATTQADEAGRFQFEGAVGGNGLAIVAPAGEPYLPAWSPLDAKGSTLRISMKRGTLLRGRIVDEGGQPVPSAEVRFLSIPVQEPTRLLFRPSYVTTDAEGRFALPVAPGLGHLVVHATRGAYLLDESVSLVTLMTGAFDRHAPACAHALRRMTIPQEGTPDEVKITLKRGQEPRVVFTQPDGTEGTDADAFSWLHPDEGAPGTFRAAWVTGGVYRLPGCDPDLIYPTVIWDARTNRGAVVDVPGKPDPKAPSRVTLAPCGSAVLRVVDAAGKVVNHRDDASLFLEQLVEPPFRAGNPRPEKAASECGSVQKVNVRNSEGIVRLSSLVPGARYRLSYRYPGQLQLFVIQESFRVAPGEEIRLPDLNVSPK